MAAFFHCGHNRVEVAYGREHHIAAIPVSPISAIQGAAMTDARDDRVSVVLEHDLALEQCIHQVFD